MTFCEFYPVSLCWFRYTDRLQEINPDQVFRHPYRFVLKVVCLFYCQILILFDFVQAEEMFDIASRYLMFPLKRAVADVLVSHLEMASPEELCQWLMLADMYFSFLRVSLLHLTLMAAIIVIFVYLS